ncbi:MAG TPA: arginine N-succinyltransferase, partial [Candidatus Binataceae bacterium]|nr:arginine N-succinyltransferase [Candidatus Binataceae bacterium]
DQAGMKFLRHIDPFDGGPYYGSATDLLLPVQQTATRTLAVGEPAPERTRQYLLAIEDREFRTVRADAELSETGKLIVRMPVLHALGVEVRAKVSAVPLP